jgi:hypothetical protein
MTNERIGRCAGISVASSYNCLGRCNLRGKQPVVLLFDDGVTFAGTHLKPCAIQDGDVAARISDQSRLLQTLNDP